MTRRAYGRCACLPARRGFRPRSCRSGLFGSRRVTTTMVVGTASRSAPRCSTTGCEPPARATAEPSRSTSSSALSPLSATNRPPSRSRGALHAQSRASGATARAMTTSAPASCRLMAGSSARPRTTLADSERVSTTSVSHATRRAIGSRSVTSRSGRAMMRGTPGNPAPDPRSTTRAPSGRADAITAELRMCRSQRRSTSRGPIKPRSTPTAASSSVNRTAAVRLSPKTVVAICGGCFT
ncbi:hypothetical protein CLV71_106160 [Actinophytocola oryzae]|uniref:Uncharacterized protein n=1 Tax=Actinophytocola oryzae TaxID=502181 RepID=A0A4R7VNB9_9PSEU|nr:hypothetical protein CLV71_106160 [Actinophytocola oryzae]